jgi:monoamine oxidase
LIGNGKVHLSSPVASIEDNGRQVAVTTTTGKTFIGKKVIISLPCAMLKDLNFSPPLPKRLKEVTDAAFIGDYNKAIIVYDRPWWRHQGFNGLLLSYTGPVCVARDTSIDELGFFSLTCFVNGHPGREWSKLYPHQRRKVVLEQLAKAYAQDKTSELFRPIEIIDQIWQHEQYSRGALTSITKIGHLTEYADVYGKPTGNVHFVGTEYSPEWKGYMEGALCSGEIGAREVIESLQNSRQNSSKL